MQGIYQNIDQSKFARKLKTEKRKDENNNRKDWWNISAKDVYHSNTISKYLKRLLKCDCLPQFLQYVRCGTIQSKT